ncbi:MAG: ATP-binding protein [Candidatus Paceibacterota bacterium]
MLDYLYQNWDLLAVGIVIVMTVIIGFIVYFANSKSSTNKIFLGLTLFISLWGISNYLSYQSQFAIEAFTILRLTIFAVTWLLFFFLLFSISFPKSEVGIPKIISISLLAWTSIISILTLTPLVFERAGEISPGGTVISVVDGPFLPLFGATTTIYALAGVVIFLVKTFKSKKETRKNFLFITMGIVFMFLSVMVSNFILPVIFNESAYIPIASLLVFPFIILTSYSMAKSNVFNVKIIGTEVFMVLLLLLALFQFIQAPDLSTIFLRGGVFISLVGVGVLLIRSVMREVEQREQLAKLNLDLKKLVQQRESLMHLITHKVKGSFTHSKYIFAGILDGTFGEVNEEIKKRSEQGLESNDAGIKTIDLVLNSANMQKGLVKYDIKKVDFKDVMLKVVSEKKISIEKKGLALEKNIEKADCYIMGDSFWIKEAVNNLVENSIKYTPTGVITIELIKQDGKIILSVKDTGIGVTEEDKKNLFTEGGRGKESVKVNVDSTGYGLYSVKLVVEAHQGRVWVESAGSGLGATFYIELPAIE